MIWLFYLITFIFGLAMGSFLDCLVIRLAENRTMLGHSVCPYCHHKLNWLDLIPLFSFAIFGGKCRHCHHRLSWEYPITELITGLLFVLVAFLFAGQSNLLILIRNFFITSILVFVFLYDLKYQLILDKIVLPTILIVFIFNLLIGLPLKNYLFAALVVTLFFALQFIISRGRWIGGGDLRLGFLLGLIVGWPGILLTLIIAYVSGTIIGLLLIIAKQKEMASAVPFAPFLVFGALITLFWGSQILNHLFYFNL